MNGSSGSSSASSRGRKRAQSVTASSQKGANHTAPKRTRISAPAQDKPSSPAKRRSGSGARALLGLTDHFPDFKLPEGRRLTRSIAKQLRRSSDNQQSSPDSPGPSSGRKRTAVAKGKEKGLPKLKQEGPATTGLCQSHDANRVFPGAEEQPPPQANEAPEPQGLQDMELRALSGALRPPSHLLGSLMPRMQHLLTGPQAHQSAKISTIMEGLKSPNEIRQSEAALELAEMLLLGNEESLPHLPVKEMMQSLMTLLRKEHNLELMLTAARCITNLLEALPRAVPVVLEAVPLLLEKLKRIECIDVAEQALTALEVLSRRHGKTIMSAGGIGATTSHLDFFSLQSQRVALQIAANCAQFVTVADFAAVRECVPELTQRLMLEDKRSLESVCSVFSRLVDNMRSQPDRLRELSGHGLLTNVQQLLLIQPPAIGSSSFQSLVRMLRQLCTRCNDLAVTMVQMGFGRTIRFLIIGTDDVDICDFELLNRPPQQLQELVLLIGEFLPHLPSSGVFEIDSLMVRQSSAVEASCWQLKDETGQWHNFSWFDTKVLEVAFQSHEHQVTLQAVGHTCVVDLDRMIQIDEVAGTARQVQRIKAANNNSTKVKSDPEKDVREEMLRENVDGMGDSLIRWLFPVLVEIDGSSAGPAIRFESMRTMLRMIQPSGSDLLTEVLGNLPLASHIASALSSSRSKDLCVVASALQVVHLLTEKLPELYGTLFRRQGVAHQIEKLSNINTEETPCNSPSRVSQHTDDTQSQSIRTTTTQESSSSLATAAAASSSEQLSSTTSKSSNSSRKKNFLPSIKLPNWAKGSHGSVSDETAQSSSTEKTARSTGSRLMSSRSSRRAAATSAEQSAAARRTVPPPGLMGLVPGSQPGMMYVGVPQGLRPLPAFTVPPHGGQMLSQMQKKRLKQWIKNTAQSLCEKFFSVQTESDGHQVLALQRMAIVAEKLADSCNDCGDDTLFELKSALLDNDLSAFELNHSGLIEALIKHLTDTRALIPQRDNRLRRFAKIFMGVESLSTPESPDAARPLQMLVSRLVTSVSQLEQLHVRTNDLLGLDVQGSLRGASALRFFQTHQIRCALRRHGECRQLKEWRHGHGSIKVDPFTQIGVIERYLVDRGVQLRSGHSGDESSGDDSNDATSDDEVDEHLGEGLAGGRSNIRLELLMGDTVLPNQMSVLQAIRQFGQHTMLQMPGQTDPLQMAAGIWVNTHVIYYRLARDDSSSSVTTGRGLDTLSVSDSQSASSISSSKKKSPSKDKKMNKIDEKLWQDGSVPLRVSPLDNYLSAELPTNLEDLCVPSLILLRILYGINRYTWCLFKDQICLGASSPVLSLSSFECAKLSAKVHRQLQDVITVATQQTPAWITELAMAVPFVLPFSVRRQLLYCVAFGRDRALMHLVSQGDPSNANEQTHTHADTARLTPRLERRKVSVKRDDLLKQAEEILGRMGGSRAILEVGFEGEVGTGFGPTMEFYSTVSRELQRFSLKLWAGDKVQAPAEHAGGALVDYVEPKNGLYPAPMHANAGGKQRDARTKKFEFIGRLMAQALIDGRMLDLSLNPVFYAWLVSGQEAERRLTVPDLGQLDSLLCKSLSALCDSSVSDLEYMAQPFTLPGHDGFELCKQGQHTLVDERNVNKFVHLVSHWRLVEGVRREMEAVRRGMESVMETKHLALFFPEEMEQLFCGLSGGPSAVASWSAAVLLGSIKPDHGYNHDSEQIRWLVQWMAELEPDMQRKFLQFVTGSPKLPVGGFRSLNPALTVVRKNGANVDGDLPSAMTCYNYLKVPAYSCYEVFCERFAVALQHVYSFYLT